MKMNTRQYFNSLSDEGKFTLLHETELKLARLLRIAEDLATFREGTGYPSKAVSELAMILEEKN